MLNNNENDQTMLFT